MGKVPPAVTAAAGKGHKDIVPRPLANGQSTTVPARAQWSSCPHPAEMLRHAFTFHCKWLDSLNMYMYACKNDTFHDKWLDSLKSHVHAQTHTESMVAKAGGTLEGRQQLLLPLIFPHCRGAGMVVSLSMGMAQAAVGSL
jgi:hypothetical protein